MSEFELEDKYEKFRRNTNIDLPAEIAAGGEPGGGGEGVTDHGALTGLSDDDHPQYLTNARGDARYYTKSVADTMLSAKADTSHNHDDRYFTESEVTTFLAGKANTTHTHQTSDMETDLGTMQDSLDDIYSYFAWHDDKLTLLGPHTVNMGGSGTLTVDCSLGNHFRAVLSGNAQLPNPTNLVDGQKIMFEFIQDGMGNRVLTVTGNLYSFSADLYEDMTLSTGAGKVDVFAGVYSQASNKILMFGRARGF